MRKSGRQDVLPFGVLARASLFRITQEFHDSWIDLEEVQEIAERGSMRLYLADYQIESCRLLRDQLSAKNYQILANGEPVTIAREEMLSQLKDHFETAKQMVKEMGYHRRDKELESLDHMGRVPESIFHGKRSVCLRLLVLVCIHICLPVIIDIPFAFVKSPNVRRNCKL